MASPRRDLAVTVVIVALTVCALAAMADRATLAGIQRADGSWLRLMVADRTGPVTAVALLLDVLGSVLVMLPIRVAIAGWLALRRRWWHFAAFVTAIVASEILIGTLKAAYDRARPPDSLVTTSGSSFPSGHAVATSVTLVAGVIALLPAGRVRARWGVAAAGFSLVMAFSRAYLGAHWLSDALAGVLIGTSCALLSALAVGALQRRFAGHRSRSPVLAPPGVPAVPSEDPP